MSVKADFYDEEYFLRGTKSGYGGKFVPYIEECFLPVERMFAKQLWILTQLKTVLVLGCARGYLVRALRELKIEAYGIDISKWALENADLEAKPFLTLGNICDLSKWQDQQFDVVVAYDVLEHVPLPDLMKAIKETVRVTKTFLLVHVPIVDNGVDKSHVSIFRGHFWRQQFNTRGFQTVYNKVVQQNDGIISAYLFFKRK